MKRIAVAVLLALLPLVAVVPAASAGSNDWCDDDPLVVIVTPAGNPVPLYNTNGAQGLEHLVSVQLAQAVYTAQPENGGTATLVKLQVTVPNDLFGAGYPTRTRISTGPMGTLDVLAETTGNAGKAMKVQFTLNVP